MAERDPRVGVTVHAAACYDEMGKCECVCGLDDQGPPPMEPPPDRLRITVRPPEYRYTCKATPTQGAHHGRTYSTR